MKKIINFMGMLLLCLAIVTFNLIAGSNQKELTILPICILMGICLAILFIKRFVYKERLIKSKVDVAVTIFMATLTLPFVFKTYCTYQGTIEFILKYFFVYAFYLLARNIVNSSKKMNIVVAITIFASFIIIIFGLDKLHGAHLDWLSQKLHIYYQPCYRFTANLGYANAASIYMVFCIFLALSRIENTKKLVIKIIYFLYIILATYIIYISYSRLVLLIYIISMTTYLVLKIYSKIKQNKKVLRITLCTFIFLIFAIIIYLAVALRFSKSYEITTISKIRKSFEKDKEYSFSFDIDVKNIETTQEEDMTPQLVMTSVNKYFKETELARIELSDAKNNPKVKITPSEDIYYIKLSIKNNDNKKIIVNNCYINDKEYILSYKYMPKVLSRMISTLSLKDESIVLRKFYYENCLRIAKDSFIIGHGGNAWKRLSHAYEDYSYAVKEAHSYFFELLISYGIVGTVAFCSILVLLNYDLIKEFIHDKEKRKQKLNVFVGTMLFLLYSMTFDFSLSFVLTLLVMFIYIAMLQTKENTIEPEKFKKTSFVVDCCIFASLIAVFVILVRANIAKYIVKDTKKRVELVPYSPIYQIDLINETNIKDLKEIQKFMLQEPYVSQNIFYNAYWTTIIVNIKDLTNQEVLQYVDFGIQRFKEIKPYDIMDFEFMANRLKIMVDAIQFLEVIKDDAIEQKITEIKEIILEEYKINKTNMEDIERNHLNLEQSQTILETYKGVLDKLKINVD